ncbi:hypothetical protein [Desulfotalea psychrophila]|uniref:hypothetical protein n=1 Tax=Desulfotalea psychrophila TaxID=84980 RepID=UPI000304D87A|nr:hypothetical protein [Desulfotalea psychrophila]
MKKRGAGGGMDEITVHAGRNTETVRQALSEDAGKWEQYLLVEDWQRKQGVGVDKIIDQKLFNSPGARWPYAESIYYALF